MGNVLCSLTNGSISFLLWIECVFSSVFFFLPFFLSLLLSFFRSFQYVPFWSQVRQRLYSYTTIVHHSQLLYNFVCANWPHGLSLLSYAILCVIKHRAVLKLFPYLNKIARCVLVSCNLSKGGTSVACSFQPHRQASTCNSPTRDSAHCNLQRSPPCTDVGPDSLPHSGHGQLQVPGSGRWGPHQRCWWTWHYVVCMLYVRARVVRSHVLRHRQSRD